LLDRAVTVAEERRHGVLVEIDGFGLVQKHSSKEQDEDRSADAQQCSADTRAHPARRGQSGKPMFRPVHQLDQCNGDQSARDTQDGEIGQLKPVHRDDHLFGEMENCLKPSGPMQHVAEDHLSGDIRNHAGDHNWRNRSNGKILEDHFQGEEQPADG
jgi:hypothetical protein